MWVFPRKENITPDVAGKTFSIPSGYKLALGIAFILAVLGVVGFFIRATSDGFGSPGPWGYYAGIFSFVFMVTGAAPLVACAFRFTKSHWRRPLSRVSEMFAIMGVVNIFLLIPLLLAMPPIKNPEVHGTDLEVRRTLWFEVPIGAPYTWDILCFVGLALCSVAILWLSVVPDMAQARATATGFRRSLYNGLSGWWYGTKRQWNAQKAGLALLGAFYFMTLVFVQFVISSDYAQSMIPGYKDAIFPVFYTLTGFQCALGLCLIILYVMRRWGGYGEYYGKSVFWAASKVQLGLTLLWAYHLFSFVITYWYGRLLVEENVIRYLMGNSYGGVFVANVILSFVIPFLLLLWNPVRRSAWGPPLAGLSALAGALMFSVRIFVGGANSGNVYQAFLVNVPPPVYPDVWDIFMVIGGIGAAAFIYLSATKFLPMLSVWEVKEGALYQKMSRFIRGEYLVLAKPE
jgi:molybdopterin-containing oxidoreductase family membrane subunit